MGRRADRGNPRQPRGTAARTDPWYARPTATGQDRRRQPPTGPRPARPARPSQPPSRPARPGPPPGLRRHHHNPAHAIRRHTNMLTAVRPDRPTAPDQRSCARATAPSTTGSQPPDPHAVGSICALLQVDWSARNTIRNRQSAFPPEATGRAGNEPAAGLWTHAHACSLNYRASLQLRTPSGHDGRRPL